jgi:hypothetical protein
VHFFIRIALAYYSARRSRPSSAAASESLVEIYRLRQFRISADLGSQPVQPKWHEFEQVELRNGCRVGARFSGTFIVAVATILAMV